MSGLFVVGFPSESEHNRLPDSVEPKVSPSNEPRAEELIIQVYAMISDARARGRQPTAVVMRPEYYAIVQDYRARLGDVAEGREDYLERYAIFGLEILVEPGAELSVR